MVAKDAFMSFFYGLGWMNIFLSDYVYLFFLRAYCHRDLRV